MDIPSRILRSVVPYEDAPSGASFLETRTISGDWWMGYVAGTLNLTADQYGEIQRTWPVTDQNFSPLALDVSTVRFEAVLLTDPSVTIVQGMSYDAPSSTFTLTVPTAQTTIMGQYRYDVQITPSTGASHAWYLLRGTLTIRESSP